VRLVGYLKRILYCTFGTGKFHTGFDDRFQAESGWNFITE